MRVNVRTYCCLATWIALLQPAWAQTDAPARNESQIQLEEIVVTARRVEEALQSTPVAVTAVTAEMIEARSLVDIRDLAVSTPNLVIQTSGANGGSQVPAVFLRGLGQADVTLTADPAVGIYVDGVFVARNSGNIFSLLDLERVEVLRGPQGTLFGKNTIGGAINLISKNPGPDVAMAAELTGGGYTRGEGVQVGG
ncbi:MAG: TonB-dependent receptor, partial [Gammaproteobacteria bacterium]|nr:TonB-dependent receptor [Gammaproteobacteria bacterium]